MHSWAGLYNAAALYTHHQYIAGFLMVERSLTPEFSGCATTTQSKIKVTLKHKEDYLPPELGVAILGSIPGLYVHNDGSCLRDAEANPD